MPYITIREERCKGCHLCVSACPKNCIQPAAAFNAQGYALVAFTSDASCTGCAACALMCPDCAISVYREQREETKP